MRISLFLFVLSIILISNTYGNTHKIQGKEYFLEAEEIKYNLKQKSIVLDGNVYLEDKTLGSIYRAKQVKIDTKNDALSISDGYGNFNKAQIIAKNIRYDQGIYQSEFVTTSLCKTCDNGNNVTPFWKIRAKKLKADFDSKDEIKLEHVYFDIFDKQVAYLPFFSVPAFWTKGKTGFLMPSMQDKGLGYQIGLPFYWYIKNNLDMTFYPDIGAKPMYGVNLRHKLQHGGYEISIYTGSLPFNSSTNDTAQKSIFRVWPADIKVNSNFFYPQSSAVCSDFMNGYEFGLKGEFALGAKPILLYKYDISDKKILVGNLYLNTTYNNFFTSSNILYFHNIKRNTRLITLPKADLYSINDVSNVIYLPENSKIISHISINGLHNEDFNRKLFDGLVDLRLINKQNVFSQSKVTLGLNLIGYRSSHNNWLYYNTKSTGKANLDIHFESKFYNQNNIIEPHIVAHVEKSSENFFEIDQSQVEDEYDDEEMMSIYSTTNNINPNNVFSSMYTAGRRSIMKKNGNHIDYGLILSRYNGKSSIDSKILWTFAARQYLSKQSQFPQVITDNQDLSLARLRDIYKEKYASQLVIEKDNIFLANRTWFTDKFQLLDNEFYIEKKFKKLSTGLEFNFFDMEKSFNPSIKQKRYNKIFRFNIGYKITDNIKLGAKSGIKFGLNSKDNKIQKFKDLKLKLEYENECIKVGFAMKKEFDKKGANDNVNSYNLYVKIPSI